MTPDEFVKFYTERWTPKSPVAFADDCRGFLREFAGDVLAKAARRLASEWDGRFPPTVPEIRTICAGMTTRPSGEFSYGAMFRYAKKRAPELEKTWLINNQDIVRVAIANKKTIHLDELLRSGTWDYAQAEYRIEHGGLRRRDGSEAHSLRPFDLTAHDRSFLQLPPVDTGIEGDLAA